jgi:hypothetical protein
MAFVSRSDLKSSSENLNNNFLGPGQYLQIYDKKRINKNKVPFLSSSPRKTQKIIEEVPGPGSYCSNIVNEKKLINNELSSNLSATALYKALEGSNVFNEIDPVQIWVNGQYERLGFLSKIKRFKENNLDGIPGPGAYIKNSPLGDGIKKLNRIKKKDIYISKKPLYEDINPNKIETIPAKNHTFGFELDLNGSLVRNSDPESINKLKGDKYNSVGPGEYNTSKPQEWLKKGTSLWSKSKINKFYQTSSNFNNKTNTRNNFLNNRTSSTLYKSTEKADNTLNAANTTNYNSEQEISNFKPNINKRSKSFDGENKISKKMEVNFKMLKAKTKKMKEILFMNHTNKLFDRSYLLKSRSDDNNPGPGYYFDEKVSTGFKSKPLPEEKQVFGSNCQRFPIGETNSVGPTYYYSEKNSIDKLKRKEIKEKLLIPQLAKIKKYKPIKVEENDLPGPGSYNIENLFELKKRVHTADCNFGSAEPRFKKLSEVTNLNVPGPGAYTGLATWGIRENNNFAKIFNKPMTVNVNIRNSTFYNDNHSKKISKSKYSDSIFDKKSKDIIPPIGTYNPDHIMNLDYKVAKNCAKNSLVEAPFNITKTRPRFDYFERNRNVSCNLGPGIYFKESFKDEKQIRNPFNNGDFRFKETKLKYETGPGQYNSNSYFDWNKKTFNILYI